MNGHAGKRLLRVGAMALCACGILAAAPPLLSSRIAPLHAAQTTQSRYPDGLEWLAGPPPAGVGTALIKTSDVAVGLVVVEGTKPGDTVSGTVVVLPKKRGDTSA